MREMRVEGWKLSAVQGRNTQEDIVITNLVKLL